MSLSNQFPPIMGIAAHKGVGKTTLLKGLLPMLCERGICTAVIKQTHDTFDVDRPDTDSYEIRKAGAQQLLLTSKQRWSLMVEREFEQPPRIEEHLAHVQCDHIDLILVEGFIEGRFPKIELFRSSLQHPLLFPNDTNIIAVASDAPLILPDHISLLDLNNIESILRFICSHIPALATAL